MTTQDKRDTLDLNPPDRTGKDSSEYRLTIVIAGVVFTAATVALLMGKLDGSIWASVALGIPGMLGLGYQVSRAKAKSR